MCCACTCSAGHKSSQWVCESAENQREQRHTLVQCRYGNRTTLADVCRDDATEKFCLTTQPAHVQQDTNQRSWTGSACSNDGRLLRAQLVASADCIYCRRYGSLDACRSRPTNTADNDISRHDDDSRHDDISRHDSDVNVSTDCSLQQSIVLDNLNIPCGQ